MDNDFHDIFSTAEPPRAVTRGSEAGTEMEENPSHTNTRSGATLSWAHGIGPSRHFRRNKARDDEEGDGFEEMGPSIGETGRTMTDASATTAVSWATNRSEKIYEELTNGE